MKRESSINWLVNREASSGRSSLKFVYPMIALLLAGGCHRGPELAPVTGSVMLDDKPLALAEVTFQPPVGRASHGQTNDSGRYALRYTRDAMGALVGPHTVKILSATEVTLPNGQFILRPQIVPTRYNSHSELHEEVKSGTQNEIDFRLQSDKK
jgi:hypothetical protein